MRTVKQQHFENFTLQFIDDINAFLTDLRFVLNNLKSLLLLFEFFSGFGNVFLHQLRQSIE